MSIDSYLAQHIPIWLLNTGQCLLVQHMQRSMTFCCTGSCFEVGWRHGHIELADESPRHDAVQALLRWSYTGRLVVPAHACDACAAMRFDDALADAVAQAAAGEAHMPTMQFPIALPGWLLPLYWWSKPS